MIHLTKMAFSLSSEMDSVRIILYSFVFLLSVFGNLLIIVVLIVNKRMRTVTNSFLLSLAVSDLMMAIFCMPFNLIPNLLEDFIFGAAMCKTVAYFMGEECSIKLSQVEDSCLIYLFFLPKHCSIMLKTKANFYDSSNPNKRKKPVIFN